MNRIFMETRNIERELRILGKKFATNINYKAPDYYVSLSFTLFYFVHLYLSDRKFIETKNLNKCRGFKSFWIKVITCLRRAAIRSTSFIVWETRQRIRMFNGAVLKFYWIEKLFKYERFNLHFFIPVWQTLFLIHIPFSISLEFEAPSLPDDLHCIEIDQIDVMQWSFWSCLFSVFTS